MFRVKISSSSTGEPLDLEEVKDHLRIEVGQTDEDSYLLNLIRTARNRVEDITHRKLMRQTVQYYRDDWSTGYMPDLPYGYGGSCISLPYPPFSTDTAPTITYKDADSSTITLSSTVYVCDSANEPGRICLDYDEDWPTTILHNVNPICIQYQCGYNGSTNVPPEIKHAMLLIISDLYENRESMVVGQIVSPIPNHIMNLLASYRIREF